MIDNGERDDNGRGCDEEREEKSEPNLITRKKNFVTV